MKKELVEKAKALESPTSSLGALLRLAASEDPTLREIENVVRQDPVLTLSLLKLANSAFYEGTQRIESVDRAIVRIGPKRVVRWMLAQATQALASPLKGYGAMEGLRSVAVLRALIAERIADNLDLQDPNPGAYYCAALLADIGKVVLDPYLDVEELRHGNRFIDREKKTYGIDHAALGARIARDWGLPNNLVSLIRWHHDPDHPMAPPGARVVCTADEFVNALAPTGLDAMENPAPASIDALGLDEEMLDQIVLEATLEHQDMLEMLQ